MTATTHSATRGMVRQPVAEDGVVVLTLDHPPANALSNALIAELTETLEALAARDDAPAVVLTGAGERFFCAGGDIKELDGGNAEQMAERMRQFHLLLVALERYPRPLVCAVNGWCVGGAVELTLFADAVYAATEARFGFPEINHGLLPAVKGIARARRKLGERAARRLLLTGDLVGVEEAAALGVVDEIVPAGELLAAATTHARAAAAKPAVLFAALKHALDRTDGWSDEQMLAATAADALAFFEDPDARAAREGWNA